MSAEESRQRLTGVFGKSFGDILLVHPGESSPQATVYSSFPLNDCPTELWSALDPAAIAAEHGADAALLNGPRCWLVDRIEQPQGPPVTKNFGGIEMRQQGTVLLSAVFMPSMDPEPYGVKQVSRNNVLIFDAGRQIYELVDPDGRTWVMQSFCQTMDINLSLSDLRTLASRLTLPAGWIYQRRTLTSPLRVDNTTADSQVILDNLGNLYSLEN